VAGVCPPRPARYRPPVQNLAHGEHAPGCVLYPANWLRHAVAALQLRLEGDVGQEPVDTLSAAALMNALEHHCKKDGWADVTLLDLARFATLMEGDDRFAAMCTCGVWGGRRIVS